MAIVSYAQNFEDVMLWRALKHIEHGFYVDVGAHEPVSGSVSRLFYEMGWRGLHVEPTPQYTQMMRENRPDEVVAAVALGAAAGQIEFTVFPDTGLSTAAPEITDENVAPGRFERHTLLVEQITLDTLLTPYRGCTIHWLKIDVEGYEGEVLKGWNSSLDRPWIFVIEATKPLSTEPYYAHWEPVLIEAHYQFVYFDGLNRFYVADERSELVAAFGSPPNVFDNFVIYAQYVAGHQQGVQAQQGQAMVLQTQLEAQTQAMRDLMANKWHAVDTCEALAGNEPDQIRQCPLCQHEAPQAQFASHESACIFGGGRLLRYVCPHCQVLFGPDKMLNLKPEELAQEYRLHYKIYQEGDSTASEMRAFFALNPQRGGKYLNFGAGGAWSKSVAALRQQGWDVYGYEPFAVTSEQAQADLATGVITSASALQALRFDGIFSNNVLEHFRYPVQELQHLAQLLKPEGRLATVTPCYEYRYEYTRFHLFFFLGASRLRLWNMAGLKELSYEQEGDYMCAVCTLT
jgi:FkbM family methyltransferase